VNIVHVVENLALGGLERVVVSLVRMQLRHGHRVLVLCLFGEGVLAPEVRHSGAQVIACEKGSGLDLRALATMRDAVKSFHADVVHTHNAVAHYYAALAIMGLGLGTVLNTRHGMGSFPYSWRRERLYRLALSGSDAAVLVCAAAERRFVLHRIIPKQKARIVPNGTDVDAFVERNTDGRRKLLEACGASGEAVVFGTVGRLSAAKDHANLLASMGDLIDQGANAFLVIVGDGELRDPLREQCAQLGLNAHVRFLGARSDIAELLSGFDVFVMSSVTEGYSLALVEACAAGLPCIATDVGGNSEIVQDNRTGIVVPAGDTTQLAAAMQALCADADRRRTFGQGARKWALENGTLDSMYRRYLAIYEHRDAATLVAEERHSRGNTRA
jgi:glycosyltransferase involved in cell wall biosynthesis